MPSETNVRLLATAGDLDDHDPFGLGQTTQNNDAESRTARTGVAFEVSPGTQATTTPALNRQLFAGAATPPAQMGGEGAVLAALRGEVLACTGDELRERFLWQWEAGAGGNAKKAEFVEEVVSGQAGNIEMFSFVQKGSTIVKMFHGITRYMGRDAR